MPETQTQPAKKTRSLRSVVILLWVVALAALGATAAVALVGRGGGSAVQLRPAPDLPVHGEVPAFSMTNLDGTTVTRRDLLGAPWVADFIFTRCKAVCPIMTLRMSQLQAQLQALPELADVKLVSFSLDPEHDTPEMLADFARPYQPDLDRWLFLTGTPQGEVWTMVEQGFKLPVEADPDNELMPISHSAHWVLVDGAGQIRGYYSSTSQEDQADLIEALRRLHAER